MVDQKVFLAIVLAALAALSTALGGLVGVVVKKPGPRFTTLSLGFSAGVMILVSFVELLQVGIKSVGFGIALVAFFVGMFMMFFIDAIIPHDYLAECNLPEEKHRSINLVRTGFFVALGICIHNFPEGLATFAGTMQSVKLGVVIAIAVALHNVPEGIAVAVPIYAATGNKKKAWSWSLFSGTIELLGAVIAAVLLMPFLNANLLGIILSMVAGIMIFISVDELIPVSRSYGHEHLSILGFILGMMAIALSLWLMG
jgi:ZIP family zinc transporter